MGTPRGKGLHWAYGRVDLAVETAKDEPQRLGEEDNRPFSGPPGRLAVDAGAFGGAPKRNTIPFSVALAELAASPSNREGRGRGTLSSL